MSNTTMSKIKNQKPNAKMPQDVSIVYIREPKRTLTIAYKILEDTDIDIKMIYGATIFRKEKSNEVWNKKQQRETALFRLQHYPVCYEKSHDKKQQVLKSLRYFVFKKMMLDHHPFIQGGDMYCYFLLRRSIHQYGVCHVTEERRQMVLQMKASNRDNRTKNSNPNLSHSDAVLSQ